MDRPISEHESDLETSFETEKSSEIRISKNYLNQIYHAVKMTDFIPCPLIYAYYNIAPRSKSTCNINLVK